MTEVRLIRIVEVSKADRVVCQAPGCKHSVYKRIHIVAKDGQITVLGSECFRNLFGEKHLTPSYGSSEAKLLTPEERQLLAGNTARLIAQFEAEHQAALEEARLAAERRAQFAAKQQAAAESARLAADQRRRLDAERRSSLAIPVAKTSAWKPAPIASRNPTPSPSDPMYQAALLQVREKYRAGGMDPDAPGWRGVVPYEAKKLYYERLAQPIIPPDAAR